MADESKRVLIVHESPLKSWINDAGTFALFASLIGLGWLIGSTTLQVVGALIGMTTLMVVALRTVNNNRFTSVAEARKRLDEIEGVS